ncbi:flagellar protein FliT [Alloalcanivorax sp. C16-2]|uniref:flagellar protein FliT n=1 Tax=Alloalcanivorax TaxID=3020832 RepID=UPI0019337BF5|nr:flagellar protein FliT [Alloalcanivorax marinus]MBL7251699.1 flagellar protein FliT [Alloalcanivorax marinus]
MTKTAPSRAPSTGEQVLQAYEGLLVRTGRMLEHARGQDWNALIEEESLYVLDVERLARGEVSVRLNERQRHRKAELLERILERERGVRLCLETRREELDQLIGLSRRRRDLNRSYGAQEAAVVDGRFDKGRS